MTPTGAGEDGQGFELVTPMLATAGGTPFSDPAWLFEPKLDGIRGLAYRVGDVVHLYSRRGQNLDRTYPEVVSQLLEQPCGDFVLDGEIVAFDGERPSFELLQQRSGVTGTPRRLARGVAVAYCVFDVIRIEGMSLTEMALEQRKTALATYFDFAGCVTANPYVVGEGEALFEQMCERGWEGVVAKRLASRYQTRRSGDWLKVKCVRHQELVVGGFTSPGGARSGFGALLVGTYDERGLLRYAGRVGSGFDRAALASIRARLDDLTCSSSPFADATPEPDVHWVEPVLVAEVRFTEWTSSGQLRHPSFLGLRDDKDARDVVRE